MAEKKPTYPELWHMYDGMDNLVAGFHEFGDKDSEEEDYGFVLQIEDTEYWAEIYDAVRAFGQKVAQELENGNVIVAPIKPEDKENVLMAFTSLGFVAKKATDQYHEEMIRELKKLSRAKVGKSKSR